MVVSTAARQLAVRSPLAAAKDRTKRLSPDPLCVSVTRTQQPAHAGMNHLIGGFAGAVRVIADQDQHRDSVRSMAGATAAQEGLHRVTESIR